jgi:hypothetical protein
MELQQANDGNSSADFIDDFDTLIDQVRMDMN